MGYSFLRNRVCVQNGLITALLKPHSCGLQIEALKSVTKSDLVTWFQAHRSNKKKVLSVHVSVSQLRVAKSII